MQRSQLFDIFVDLLIYVRRQRSTVDFDGALNFLLSIYFKLKRWTDPNVLVWFDELSKNLTDLDVAFCIRMIQILWMVETISVRISRIDFMTSECWYDRLDERNIRCSSGTLDNTIQSFVYLVTLVFVGDLVTNTDDVDVGQRIDFRCWTNNTFDCLIRLNECWLKTWTLLFILSYVDVGNID